MTPARDFSGLRVLAAMGIVVAVVAALVLLGAARPLGRAVLFPAPRTDRVPSAAGAQLHRIAAPEPGAGEVLALHWPAPEGAPTVVHFHGNGEMLSDQAWLGLAYRERGLGFYAVEYPGYGAAPGSPSEASIFRAASVALTYLRTLNVARERTVIQGFSLGSGAATELAAQDAGGRLVLFAPLTSVPDFLGALSWLPRTAVPDRFDNASKAPRIRIPVLIVHGTRDSVVPFRMGARLSKLFPDARLRVVEGADHGDLFTKAVLDEVAAFAR